MMFSGFAGVYFERILKTSSMSLWMRNIQLAIFSGFIALFIVVVQDSSNILSNGFFQGWNFVTIIVVFIQAIGGLIISIVVKYADNILKGFATSISIILSSIMSIFIFDFSVTFLFILGSALVLVATYFYQTPPSRPEDLSRREKRFEV